MRPIEQLRRALGLSQTDFGRALGVSQGHVSSLERGSERLGGQTALRAADRWRLEMNRLGITVEDLIRGSRDQTEAPPAEEPAA